MYKKVSLGLLMGTFVALTLFVCCAQARENEFTADMVEHISGKTKMSKIYVKGEKYRLEQEEDGLQIIVIVDQDAGVTRVLLPGEKKYIEMESKDPESLMNDPFQSFKFLSTRAEKKYLGREKVSDYDCDKYVITDRGQDLMTQWISQSLKFPIKIVNHTTKMSMELRNIQEGLVEDALFQIPAGYEKMGMPGKIQVSVPEWAKEVPSSPLMNPPFQNSMSAQEIIRVSVEAGKEIEAEGKNEIDGRSVFTVVPFLDGKPTKDPSECTYKLLEKGKSRKVTCKEITREADEIVIRVKEGKVMLEVKQIELAAGEAVSAGGELRVSVEAGRYVEVRIENLISGESVCTVTFFQEGKELSEKVIGPVGFRTFTLNSEKMRQQRTWSTEADEIVIRVEKGQMLIRVKQR